MGWTTGFVEILGEILGVKMDTSRSRWEIVVLMTQSGDALHKLIWLKLSLNEENQVYKRFIEIFIFRPKQFEVLHKETAHHFVCNTVYSTSNDNKQPTTDINDRERIEPDAFRIADPL